MVSTHLKNISPIGSFPQVVVKTKNIWNHQLAKNWRNASCEMKGPRALIESSEISWHVVMTHRFDHLHTHLDRPRLEVTAQLGIFSGSFWVQRKWKKSGNYRRIWINITLFTRVLWEPSQVFFFSRISIPSTYHQQLCAINSKVKMFFVFWSQGAAFEKNSGPNLALEIFCQSDGTGSFVHVVQYNVTSESLLNHPKYYIHLVEMGCFNVCVGNSKWRMQSGRLSDIISLAQTKMVLTSADFTSKHLQHRDSRKRWFEHGLAHLLPPHLGEIRIDAVVLAHGLLWCPRICNISGPELCKNDQRALNTLPSHADVPTLVVAWAGFLLHTAGNV